MGGMTVPADLVRICYEDEVFVDTYDDLYGDETDDLGFWTSLPRRRDRPVLQLACGTGRITVAIGRQGYEVDAVDRSTAMLARLREKIARDPGLRVRPHLADIRSFPPGRDVRLGPLPGELLRLPRDRGQRSAMSRRRTEAHARRVAAGVRRRAPAARPAPERSTDRGFREVPRRSGVGTVQAWETARYCADSQILHLVDHLVVPGVVESHEPKHVRVPWRIRIHFACEIRRLLRHAGFDIVEVFGDYRGSPLESDSLEQIYLVRPTRRA